MIEIEKPRIECQESPDDISYGKFVVEPLERGYGTTLGNSLRRVLLSSLPGTAPTSIRIAGVQHEFSTIPGVKEDVTEIVLNVKGIIARLHCDGPKTVYIEAAGECEVTAGDIKADGEVEILNPELHIASLGPDGALSMEITLAHGRGYVPADKNKSAQQVIGTIPGGQHLCAGPEGQLRCREHPCGQPDGLRQADHRGLDRQDHLGARRAEPRRQDPVRSLHALHRSV